MSSEEKPNKPPKETTGSPKETSKSSPKAKVPPKRPKPQGTPKKPQGKPLENPPAPLRVVPPPPVGSQPIDMDKLREDMVAGIYTLEGALFTQSGFEYERIKKIRGVVNTFEETLLSPEAIAQMNPRDKLKLYGMLLRNMDSSLSFLQNLHNGITTGVDAINQIEKLKSVKPSSTGSTSQDMALEQVKARIRELIRQKSQEPKPNK